jgi:hypothetical protein
MATPTDVEAVRRPIGAVVLLARVRGASDPRRTLRRVSVTDIATSPQEVGVANLAVDATLIVNSWPGAVFPDRQPG